MVYLPRDKAAWAILSELNMCGMQEHANHVSRWILSTFCEVYARKNAFRYPGTVLGIGQSFWKKLTNVEMFTMKNNAIIVIWFLSDVQNYADLR